MNLIFLPEAWEDYLYWQGQDKKTLKRINTLIRDIMRDHYHGLGKQCGTKKAGERGKS